MVDAVDILNQGYRAAGLQKRVQEFYEGSEAARIATEIYSETRDEVINSFDWDCTRAANVALVLLKGPPPAGGYSPTTPWSNIYPAPGYLFEYVYPTDCITVRAIIQPPLGPMPDLDPLPALWRVDTDAVPVVSGSPPTAAGPPAKVILTNIAGAMITYRRQVTDPSIWDVSLTEAVIAALGRKLAIAFGANPQEQQAKTQAATGTLALATSERG